MPATSGNDHLRAGDMVLIRTRMEIEATLDASNHLRGCGFMDEMWEFCGTRQRVLKRVERYLDEKDYVVRRLKGLVILQNVQCEGTADYGRCDRTCYYFWREEWLQKIDDVVG